MPSGEDDLGRGATDRPASQQQSIGEVSFGSGSNNQVIVEIRTDRPGHQQSAGSGQDPGVDLPATPGPEESLPPGWKWFFAICAGLITLFALPLFVNLLTGQNPLPAWLQAMVPYSTQLIGGSMALLGILYFWQTRLQSPGSRS